MRAVPGPAFQGRGLAGPEPGALARLKKLGARIRPREWNSGEHVVLMGVVAPFGGAEQVVEEVKAKIFAGKAVHMLQEIVSSAE